MLVLEEESVPSSNRNLQAFFMVWNGQFISILGSNVLTFVLGLWVLNETAANADFTLLSFYGALPGIAVLPIAGALTDRWGNRRTMLIADIGESAAALVLAV